jgi:hypothetical protein
MRDSDFFIRTEEIRPEEVLDYFVETERDRQIINALKSRNPVILASSRGVGKSFLFRVAEAELLSSFEQDRVFPVYETFTKSSLILSTDKDKFQNWMLARICSRIIRSLAKKGLLITIPSQYSILAGEPTPPQLEKTKIEKIAEAFEASWENPTATIDVSSLPSVDAFKDAIEDICIELKIARVNLFIDEAAHILLPEQQRQFFTLFRDLRSPYISCNAAIYPGVTSFGETFQPAHDATMLTIERDILSSSYISNMREIVEKQADSKILANIAKNGQNFALLAYAASGNPRILFKTLNRAPKVNSSEVNEVIRQFYKTEMWSEHSNLAEKYTGHKTIVDWGRNFIEYYVLPEIQKKNEQYLLEDKKCTCFFWIHRDAPEPVKEALRLLCYTGIVSEHSTGIKATRSEIGIRYAVNLGCLFGFESVPTVKAYDIAKNLDPRRMTEYGFNHPAYTDIMKFSHIHEEDMTDVLINQLTKDIDVLDITQWQKDSLRSLTINTIGDVVKATESSLRKAHYVGEKRSRMMRNAAIAAVYEYLSG